MKKVLLTSACLIAILGGGLIYTWNGSEQSRESTGQSGHAEQQELVSGQNEKEVGGAGEVMDSNANDDRSLAVPSIEWRLRPDERLLKALRSGADYSSTLLEVADAGNWTEKQLHGELIAFERACMDQPGFTFNRIELEDSISIFPGQLMRNQFQQFCSDFLQSARPKLEALDNNLGEEESLAEWQAEAFQDEAIGSEAGLDAALWDLRDALDSVRYMAVVESTWILGTRNLLDPLIPESTADTRFGIGPQNGLSILTFEAVAAALMCRRIGGCSSTNPLLLNLCTLSVERPCYRPNSIFDAADQILTGFERQHFYHYLNQIETLLVQRT